MTQEEEPIKNMVNAKEITDLKSKKRETVILSYNSHVIMSPSRMIKGFSP